MEDHCYTFPKAWQIILQEVTKISMVISADLQATLALSCASIYEGMQEASKKSLFSKKTLFSVDR